MSCMVLYTQLFNPYIASYAIVVLLYQLVTTALYVG